jgi:hypothetical protein
MWKMLLETAIHAPSPLNVQPWRLRIQSDIYKDSGCILLNCFALGPWATGMNVSLSLVDVGILKSLGPEQKKLENSLELFELTISLRKLCDSNRTLARELFGREALPMIFQYNALVIVIVSRLRFTRTKPVRLANAILESRINMSACIDLCENFWKIRRNGPSPTWKVWANGESLRRLKRWRGFLYLMKH